MYQQTDRFSAKYKERECRGERERDRVRVTDREKRDGSGGEQ